MKAYPIFNDPVSRFIVKRGRWLRLPWAMLVLVTTYAGGVVGLAIGLVVIGVMSLLNVFFRGYFTARDAMTILKAYPWRGVFVTATILSWHFATARRVTMDLNVWPNYGTAKPLGGKTAITPKAPEKPRS